LSSYNQPPKNAAGKAIFPAIEYASAAAITGYINFIPAIPELNNTFAVSLPAKDQTLPQANKFLI